MTKSNKILVGVLAFVVSVLMGYALFSETITVTGTATAKGDFEITKTCSAGFMSDLINEGAYPSADYNQNGFSNDSCSVNGSKVTFSTTLAYPGARRYFTVKLENTGSIPAIVDGANTNSDYLLKDLKTKVCALNKDGSVSTNCTTDVILKSGSSQSASPIGENKLDFIISDKYCNFFDDCMADFDALYTGDAAYYSFPLIWPQGYESGYQYGFSATVTADIPMQQKVVQ